MTDPTTESPEAGTQQHAETHWDPELTESLGRLRYDSELGSAQFDAALQDLEKAHGEAVYSEFIHLLTHLRFEPGEAKGHWGEILSHHQSLDSRIDRGVDIRVAIVSYFLEVARELRNPTVIEMHLLEQTEALAYRDELTGLRNYRFFREYLAHEILRCDQYDSVLSLVMIDVDNFKQYNDRYGHEAGNRALAEIGRALTETVRKVDVVARYGGEEFVVLVSSTSKIGAKLLAERIRDSVELRFEEGGEKLTVSLGIAAYPGDGQNAEELIRNADRALYLAKANGKNRSEYYDLNRRSFLRVPVEVAGSCTEPATQSRDISTVDLSEGGARFAVDRDFPAGALVEITLDLPGQERSVKAAARVVYSRGDEGVRFDTAVRIIDMASPHRLRLRRFLAARGSRD